VQISGFLVSVLFGWMCYIHLFAVTNSYNDAAIINKHSTVTENFIVIMSYSTVQKKKELSSQINTQEFVGRFGPR